MPVYVYKCCECNHIFDFFARTLSEPPPQCPNCGHAFVDKQFCSFAVNRKERSTECSSGKCSLLKS